jgi:hypothetical protein
VKAHVVLTGGSHSGTYDATPAGSSCLNYQSTSLDGLGIAYFGEPGTKGIASIDFGTQAKVPTAGATDDFGFTVGIGTGDTSALAAMGTNFVVRPKDGRGKGTATVKGSGPRYTVVVSGTTDDGVKVDATLECLK